MTAGQGPRLLLLGAGHANLLAVRALRHGLPEARLTLIDASPHAFYSGMLPGHVAGHYTLDQTRVDLARFCARHGLTFLQGRIEGLDPVARQVTLGDGTSHGYDLAALDVGSHTAMPEIAGFDAHGVPIKPLGAFLARLARDDPAAPVALIGGGVAGAEIALALHHRGTRRLTLIEAGPTLAATLGPRARRHLRAALDHAGIRVLTGAQIAAVTPEAVILQDGAVIDSRVTIGIAGARAHAWPGRTLPVDDRGFVRVTPTLQVEDHPALFAVGDCAAMGHAPRPKAGVYAVRQAPDLAANLIAAARGRPLRRHRPQRDALKIIALGGRTGLAEWRGLTLHGAWMWRWKDRIDRRFMAGLQGSDGGDDGPEGA